MRVVHRGHPGYWLKAVVLTHEQVVGVAVRCGYDTVTGPRPLQPGTRGLLDPLLQLDALSRCKSCCLLELILFKLYDLVRVHVLVVMSEVHQVLARPVGTRVPLQSLLLIAVSDRAPIGLAVPLLHVHGL